MADVLPVRSADSVLDLIRLNAEALRRQSLEACQRKWLAYSGGKVTERSSYFRTPEGQLLAAQAAMLDELLSLAENL